MSIRFQIRKLLVVGALLGLVAAGHITANVAHASDPKIVQISSNLSRPYFIAEFNGGLYFTARDTAAKQTNIYFYDGSGEPRIVTGGEDSGSMDGDITVYKNDIYFTTSAEASYRITKGNKTSVTKMWATLDPSRLVAINMFLYFLGRETPGGDFILYLWNGSTDAPQALGDVAPKNFAALKTFNDRLLLVDSNEELWLSSNANGQLPSFFQVSHDLVGSSINNRETNTFQTLGDKLYFQTKYDGNRSIMNLDLSEYEPKKASIVTFDNGDVLVNASGPIIHDNKVFVVGKRQGSELATESESLYVINASGKLELAPGIDTSIKLSTDVYGGGINTTGAGIIPVGGLIILNNNDTGELFTYKQGSFTKMTYNGSSIEWLASVAAKGNKMVFGASLSGAPSGTNEQRPVFMMDLTTEAITVVNMPTDVQTVFFALGGFFLGAQESRASGTLNTLWAQLPSKPAAGKSKSKRVSGFYGDSSWINPDVARSLKALAQNPSAIKSVKCTGTTAARKASALDRRLALARGKAACAYFKQLAPKAKVTVVAKPATGTATSNRAVLIEITR
jgi:hypothetical protein